MKKSTDQLTLHTWPRKRRSEACDWPVFGSCSHTRRLNSVVILAQTHLVDFSVTVFAMLHRTRVRIHKQPFTLTVMFVGGRQRTLAERARTCSTTKPQSVRPWNLLVVKPLLHQRATIVESPTGWCISVSFLRIC